MLMLMLIFITEFVNVMLQQLQACHYVNVSVLVNANINVVNINVNAAVNFSITSNLSYVS